MKNLDATPTVRLRLAGGWWGGAARRLHGPDDNDAARRASTGTVVPFDLATCKVHRRGRPSRAKIIELTTAWFEGGLPIAIDLEADVGKVRA